MGAGVKGLLQWAIHRSSSHIPSLGMKVLTENGSGVGQ